MIPPALLRSLMWHESRNNPRAVSPTGARGIMQITSGALSDYNRARGTRYGADDLFRPQVSVAVGTWLLQTIARSYARHHPRSLATDWSDPRFVQLVVLGWNRGWSEEGGVGRVVGRLEREGWPASAITADTVVAHAARCGAAGTLYDAPRAHVRWSGQVVASYLAAGAAQNLASASRADVGPIVAALALVTGIGVALARQ